MIEYEGDDVVHHLLVAAQPFVRTHGTHCAGLRAALKRCEALQPNLPAQAFLMTREVPLPFLACFHCSRL